MSPTSQHRQSTGDDFRNVKEAISGSLREQVRRGQPEMKATVNSGRVAWCRWKWPAAMLVRKRSMT